MSGQPPDTQETTQQILNDIQTLQTMEQQLLNSLETNPSLTTQQQEQIIQKIKDISSMRINLYRTLNNISGFYQNSLSSSQGTLQEQTSAIQIIENELKKSRSRLQFLEEAKNNKIRLVEINTYFGEKYAEHANLMKIIIFTLVPVIILAILHNKKILPDNIYYILVSIVSLIGAIFFWRRMFSIWRRNNMEYQTYDWYFDASGANTTNPSDLSGNTDPWASQSATCIGSACCSSGQTWDASLNQCIGTSSVTETFVNNVLTKTSSKYKQPDVRLNGDSIMPNTGESFINYKKFK